jgi:class 3 adenylate cyclase
VVNLASRLCDHAKAERVAAFADASTYASAGRPEGWHAAGRLNVRGRRERAEIYGLAPAERPRRRWYGTPFSSSAERRAP